MIIDLTSPSDSFSRGMRDLGRCDLEVRKRSLALLYTGKDSREPCDIILACK